EKAASGATRSFLPENPCRNRRGRRQLPSRPALLRPLNRRSISMHASTRRDFLHQAGLGAAGLTLLPDLAFPAERSPAEQIRIGHIGVGNQGKGNLKYHIKNTVAVCEVDGKRLAAAKAQV